MNFFINGVMKKKLIVLPFGIKLNFLVLPIKLKIALTLTVGIKMQFG